MVYLVELALLLVAVAAEHDKLLDCRAFIAAAFDGVSPLTPTQHLNLQYAKSKGCMALTCHILPSENRLVVH